MQLHFRLTPVADITPWGAERGQPSLHWYGLTDGWFSIEVGGRELFRYSREALDYWARQDPGKPPPPLPYENYQVARYWEDLLELLPAVLDPLPPDLAALAADAPRWDDRQREALQWQEAQTDDSAWDTYYTAIAWWGRRTWDAGHLSHPPCIALWRVADTVHVRWDNRPVIVDARPVWTATTGEATLPVSEFLAAVASFHDRFLTEMEQRVSAVAAEPLSGVKIDLAALRLEQTERRGWLEAALHPRAIEAQRDSSWDDVRAALASIPADGDTSL